MAECLLHGNLEKWPFLPISSLRNHNLSSEYHVYACGKMILRASILNEISNFSSSPHVLFDSAAMLFVVIEGNRLARAGHS